jgi:YggT family protein
VQGVLCALLTSYIIIMAGRMIMSWLPPSGGAMGSVNRVLTDLTEPVLAPVRRLIPPVGVFDISFMVVFFALVILRSVVCG